MGADGLACEVWTHSVVGRGPSSLAANSTRRGTVRSLIPMGGLGRARYDLSGLVLAAVYTTTSSRREVGFTDADATVRPEEEARDV